MSSVEHLIPWDQQPQEAVEVDSGNPLAAGLFTGFANPSGATIGLGALNSGTLAPSIGTEGVAFVSDSSTALATFTGDHSPGSSELTVLVRAVRFGAQPDGGGFGLAVTLLQVSGSQDPFQLFIKTSGERIRVNTTTVDQTANIESSQDWPVNQIQTGVYTWRSGADPILYRNGVRATGITSTYTTKPSGVLKPAQSLRINSSALRLNGAVYLVLVWNRALTDEEIAQVSANPWQLFRPRILPVPAAAGGGGGVVSVSPAGIASGEAFGTATVTRRSVQAVTATGIASAEAFGTATVTRRTGATISPAGIASAEAFGSAAVLRISAQSILPPGIVSAEAFGSATLARSVVGNVSPAGIASAEAFGSHVFAPYYEIRTTGIPSGQAFGFPVVSSDLLPPAFAGGTSRPLSRSLASFLTKEL